MLFLFQMCLADANLSFPVHSLTIKRSGQDSPKECKEVNLFDSNIISSWKILSTYLPDVSEVMGNDNNNLVF